ncbi:MAG: 23S rRNA (uracil(1939)-C(5))-methyltransferase RlmD [Azoarcus sp.]|jgi:23S rRNA (uracil1939-C5)-methyltransferase|nr:23S rRNA (uracil(1939)-C(5))-methyltransferase RlmD [Azoarcus sp.]
MPIADIEFLDYESRGIARAEGKIVFVEGALPGETVEYEIRRSKPNYDQARATRIVRASAQRVAPPCPHFGVCGGCSLQHLDPLAQAAVKQRVMEDAFGHIARIGPEVVLPAISGPAWGYRHRARLGVRRVPDRGGMLIGFHEKRSSYIADLGICPVLPPHLSAMLPALHELADSLSIRDRIPQIEVAMGGSASGKPVTVLVFRHLLPFSDADAARLAAFGAAGDVEIWRQPDGPESAQPLSGGQGGADGAELAYFLPEYDLRLAFRPTDFTQVNVHTNRLLIRRAMQLLDPRPGERIADLFCGLGNFTLPIARRGATVTGVEGSNALAARAMANAHANGLAARVGVYAVNLFETTEDSLAALGFFDKMLLDPPREGAIAVVKAIARARSPWRIVYVSCNPATLARDAAVLVREKGYALRGAGIVNMFPHTSHVETVALFERF